MRFELKDINYRIADIWDGVTITNMWSKMMDEVQLVGRETSKIENKRYLIYILPRLERPDCHAIVAEYEGEPIGFITGYIHYNEYGTSKLIGTCDDLFVEPEFRTVGGDISLKLIDDLIYWATSNPEAKAEELEFITKYDLRLIKIWERRGYTPAQITYVKCLGEENGKCE